MDGVCMAAEIKLLRPDAVIIAVTAYMDTKQLMAAIEIGIDHYLLKPLPLEKLFALSNKVVASNAEILEHKRCEVALCLNEKSRRI